MRIKLYSEVQKDSTKVVGMYGKITELQPEALPEEYLGTFDASEFTAPNGRKYIIVHGQRNIKLNPDTMTGQAFNVSFRGERVD